MQLSYFELMTTFCALDVETANTDRASICQIGISIWKDGAEIRKWSSYINPKVPFDRVCINVHGIRESDVQDAPTFEECYLELQSILGEGIVVVHHSPFDRSAWAQATAAAGLQPMDIRWLDSCSVAKESLDDQQRAGFGLKALSERFGIQFMHHDAYEDARATAELMMHLNRISGHTVEEWYEQLGVSNSAVSQDRRVPRKSRKGGVFTSIQKSADDAVASLKGLLEGIGSDEVIEDLEIEELRKWVDHNEWALDRLPYSELLDAIRSIGGDQEERMEAILDVHWLCKKLEEDGEYACEVTRDIKALLGFFQGILSDGQLTDDEVFQLEAWLEQHEHLRGHAIYDGICNTIADVLEDGIITEEERARMVSEMNAVTEVLNPAGKKALKGNPQPQGKEGLFDQVSVTISGYQFVLTGDFDCGPRAQIESQISNAGGLVGKSPSKKTGFVVIGNQGSEAWAYARFGRKVEKALTLQSKGVEVFIIQEEQLVQALATS